MEQVGVHVVIQPSRHLDSEVMLLLLCRRPSAPHHLSYSANFSLVSHFYK